MHEVEALEGVLDLDAAVQVSTAAGASVSLDSGAGVHNLQLGLVGGDGQVVSGHDADDGEQGASRLPALRAPAGVVVSYVG